MDILKNNIERICKQSFLNTFQNFKDDSNINDIFSKTFSKLFSKSIQSYLINCKGTPTGGPLIIYENIDELQNNLFNTGKSAYIKTFQNYEDENNIADSFGDGIKMLYKTIIDYLKLCKTITGVPISPGGLLIAEPSEICVPEFKKYSRIAYKNTFQNFEDENNIAELFSNIFKSAGLEIGEYVMRCSSPPGGGNLISS